MSWDNECRTIVGSALVHTAECFGTKFPAERLKAYLVELEDLDPAEVVKSLLHARRTSDYFPTIARIRKAAGEDGSLAASLGWKEALGAIRKFGADGAAHHASEDVNRAVQLLGGWTVLGQAKTADLHFTELRFRERFEELNAQASPLSLDNGQRAPQVPRLDAGAPRPVSS